MFLRDNRNKNIKKNNKILIIKFEKQANFLDGFNYTEIKDSYILNTLSDMQDKYGFKILKTNLKDCFYNSFIKLKCDKNDKFKIYSEFCNLLDGYIKNIDFK